MRKEERIVQGSPCQSHLALSVMNVILMKTWLAQTKVNAKGLEFGQGIYWVTLAFIQPQRYSAIPTIFFSWFATARKEHLSNFTHHNVT